MATPAPSNTLSTWGGGFSSTLTAPKGSYASNCNSTQDWSRLFMNG